MKALVYQEKVIQIEPVPFDVHPNYVWIDCDNSVQVGDSWNGVQFTSVAIPIPTMEEVLKEYTDALQVYTDNKAREKSYDNTLSIATYVNSTNATWQAEAQAFVAWRDEVYVYGLQVLAASQESGSRPSIEEFLAGLPILIWP
jgi:hypothetical protein